VFLLGSLREIENPDPSQDSDTDTVLICAGDAEKPISCQYFEIEDQISLGTPWCKRFQIHPKCCGDINHCDVLMYAPDPRDGYR